MESKTTRTARDWSRVWIFSGAALAILLLGSSVMNYVSYTRFAALRNTRLAMARQVGPVTQLIKNESAAGLSPLLDQMVEQNRGSLAWIQILDRQGAVIARSGAAAAPAFEASYVAARLRDRQPIFTVRQTGAGAVVVEAFPIRVPAPAASSHDLRLVSLNHGPVVSGMGFLEIASFANSAGFVAWPARWSLILGTTAGVALLGALVVLSIRSRQHRAAQRVEQQMDIARVLGLLPNAGFEQGVECLEQGDILVMYSDGIVEAANASGEEFGEHRLIAAIESSLGDGPDAIRDRILQEVRMFTASDRLEDDQTLLAIRYTGAAEAMSLQAA